MAENTFEHEPTSRYQLTPMYRRAGSIHYGLFQAPKITLDDDEDIVAVTEATKGQLEIFSFNAYGDVKYFWAVGLVNKISNAAEDVIPGMSLTIPKLERVLESLEER